MTIVCNHESRDQQVGKLHRQAQPRSRARWCIRIWLDLIRSNLITLRLNWVRHVLPSPEVNTRTHRVLRVARLPGAWHWLITASSEDPIQVHNQLALHTEWMGRHWHKTQILLDIGIGIMKTRYRELRNVVIAGADYNGAKPSRTAPGNQTQSRVSGIMHMG